MAAGLALQDESDNSAKRSTSGRHAQQTYSRFLFSFATIIALSVAFCSCSSLRYSRYQPDQKIAPGKLKEDFIVLKKTLEANHPSLYWYTRRDSLDRYFAEAIDGMNDSLTEFQFRSKVAWYLSKIRCGHTSVRPSKAYSYYLSRHESEKFPLLLKAWEDSLVVVADLNSRDTVFKRGVVINSIDGRSNRALLDSMFEFISTDGYANNFKNQAVSFNFPLYYSFAFPLKDSFLIDFTDSAGTKGEAWVKLYKPPTHERKPSEIPGTRPPTHAEKKAIELLSKRNIVYDTANQLAYMRIATFEGGKLTTFFRRNFSELKNRNIPNLVIDLRENTGGNISTTTRLTRYLKDTSFRIADTAAAISRSLPYGRYIHPAWLYHVVMRFTTRKKNDDRFHFVAIERHRFKPYRRLHYDGNVYIIQGGYTFSAAAMFVESLKGQRNVTVTGEETGGGAYGTTAVHLPTIVLPHSKLRVTLPLYRVVPDNRKTKTGQGIQPDIYIPPSSVAIRNGIDPKLQRIRELIRVNVMKR